MLKSLSIENLATIESLTIEFGPSLSALTGETGAGKSIVVGGLGLALGGRASADDVRPGRKPAVVEACFKPPLPASVRHLIRGELELEWDAKEPLSLRREVSRAGRSRCFVNGQMVGVGDLKRIGELLVDFHGQHEHQSLLRPGAARRALDAYGGHEALLKEVQAAWDEARNLRRRREELECAARDFEQRLDYLDFQLEEIRRLDPQPGEMERLEHEERRLARADALVAQATEAYAMLYEGRDDGHGQASLLGLLREVERRLGELAEVEPPFADALERLAEQKAALEDLAFSLRDYAESVRADPGRLDEVIARLEEFRRLARKHGGNEATLLEARAAMESERERMTRDDAERGQLGNKLKRAEARLRGRADKLSRGRRAQAKRFAGAVLKLLRELQMEKARFEIEIEPLDAPGADGADRVDFLLAANPGLPPAPLRKVASGGELSRVMLALKSTLARRDVIPTLVFDEIDAGLSAETARRVGGLMERLAASHQILCVTHHAPIAARAARHVAVQKQTRRRATYTEIETLTKPQRIEALAKMMGGDASAKAARQLAKELMG